MVLSIFIPERGPKWRWTRERNRSPLSLAVRGTDITPADISPGDLEAWGSGVKGLGATDLGATGEG